MKPVYDLYLHNGLTGKAPLELTPAVKKIVSQRHPGWLGLNLPQAEAIELFRRLKTNGAAGLVVLAVYRDPQVTAAAAQLLAEREFNRILQSRPDLTQYQFEPLALARESVLWWVFFSGSEQLQEIKVPGGLTIAVDKVDGHIWTANDQAAFFTTQEALLRQAERAA